MTRPALLMRIVGTANAADKRRNLERKMMEWSAYLIEAKAALSKAETDMALGRDAPTMAIAINALLRCERVYNESNPSPR